MSAFSGCYDLCRNSRGRTAGFTLVELIIVIIIVSVLATVAAERMFYYQERAEKVAMDTTLAALKMGLQIRLAELLIANRQMMAAELERENPMRWLGEPPSNYAGEYRTPVKAGNWYFANDARQLVYIPNSTNYLQLQQGDSVELRFQAKVRYDDIATGGGNSRSPTGVGIVPARAYRWF